jgi:hypothetical protein
MPKSKPNTHIKLLAKGIQSGDWTLVEDYYFKLTKESLTAPPAPPGRYDDIIQALVDRFDGAEGGSPSNPLPEEEDDDLDLPEAVVEAPTKKRGRPPAPTVATKKTKQSVPVAKAAPSSVVIDLGKTMKVMTLDKHDPKVAKKNSKLANAVEKISRDPADLFGNCRHCQKQFPKQVCIKKTSMSGERENLIYNCPYCKMET